MRHKYKIPLWNLFCTGAIIILTTTLIPHIKNASCEYKVTPPAAAIKQINTTSIIYKRGKHASTTTVEEGSSSTQIDQTKSHTSEGWTKLTWRRDVPES
ncbi:MAG: hypothetical protein S4CHLAM20_03960 [Chlamydiia bacterium]|nr:hypothetical protein [Chlamydiia bacterium]